MSAQTGSATAETQATPKGYQLQSGLLPRPDTTRAWEIRVNGKTITDGLVDVRTLQIVCARNPGDPERTLIGLVEYGAEPKPDGNPSGYDTFLFWEYGGAVTVPWTFIGGELYVGMVIQRRFAETHATYCPDGKVKNAPRGFHNIRGLADETAKRELKGEVGVFEGETVRLNGENANANNAWFKYRDELDSEGRSVRQGGVAAYAVKVNAAHLIPGKNEDEYVFDPTKLGERPKGSSYEVISGCTFVHWTEAVRSRDGFTCIAISRLLADLHEARTIDVYDPETAPKEQEGGETAQAASEGATMPAPPPVVSSAPPAPGGPALPGVV